MREQVKVKWMRVHKNAVEPTRGSEDAACWDISSLHPVWLNPDKRVHLIETGIAFEVPVGWEMEIRPRSGLSRKSIIISNSPGTLDADYRGQLLIMLQNYGSEWYYLHGGDRIAQVKINPVYEIDWEETEKLSETARGFKGFGSTGR